MLVKSKFIPQIPISFVVTLISFKSFSFGKDAENTKFMIRALPLHPVLKSQYI